MKWAYRIAILCGTLPLSTGISIFLLWCATGWEWLEVAGMFTISMGAGLFIVGCIALGIYFWIGRKSSALPRRELWRSTLIAAVILWLNFPVALGLFLAAMKLARIPSND